MSKSDFDFEGDNEAVLDEKGAPNVDDSEEEATEETSDLEDEYYMDDDDPLEVEDEGDEEEVEKEAEVEEKPDKEEVEGDDPYSKIRDDVIKALPDGEDTTFIVKGKEYRAADIPAKEWVNVLQKGIRADQLFAEMGTSRRSLEQERELLRRNNEQAQRVLDEYGQGSKKTEAKTSVPDFLKPNELDTDEMKTLKQYAADVTQRVSTLEIGAKNAEIGQLEHEVLTEIKGLQKEYPQASVDEVLAVRGMGVPESTEELMRISNDYYSSLKFIEKSLEVNPTAARELEEKIIKKHYAKSGKPRNVGVKRSRTSGSKKVSTKPSKKIGLDFDFDKAEEGSIDYLSEMRKLRDRNL